MPVPHTRLVERFVAAFIAARSVMGSNFHVTLMLGNAREFPGRRDRAYCSYNDENDEIAIYVSPTLVNEPNERIDGVLRHEFGHAALFFLGQPNHSEREADDFARVIWGTDVRYDVDDIQTTGVGKKPRPNYLPR